MWCCWWWKRRVNGGGEGAGDKWSKKIIKGQRGGGYIGKEKEINKWERVKRKKVRLC